MQKPLKTSKELSDMIQAKMGVVGLRIDVHPDPIYGWSVTVYTSDPARIVGSQQVASGFADILREQYDLLK